MSKLRPQHTTNTRWQDFVMWGARGLLLLSSLWVLTAYLPLLPVDWWWVRIGDYPRLQLLISYVVLIVALLPLYRRRPAQIISGLLLGGVLIQLYWITPWLPVAPTEVEDARDSAEEKRLRILTANVLQENTDSARLLKLIVEEQPDIVVLCEVNDRWIADLKPLHDQFSFQLEHPLDNTYGIAMYSRLPVQSATVRGIVREEIPSIDARIQLKSGQQVRLFAVHPNPPRPGEDTTKRDAELILVGREVSDDDRVIVLGDMNDVGWSRTTNLFQEVSGLLDPRKGRGMFPTFNAKSMIWRYPLDYLFHSDDFRVAELKTLSDIGSDHYPLLVELSYEPDATVTQEAPDLDSGDNEDADEAVEAVK